MHKKLMATQKSGFTFIELLIVIAVLVILAILALTVLPNQLRKARDAERKRDLSTIKVAFEDYYNDNGEYPPLDTLEVCGSEEFSPYLAQIPCDPNTIQPYAYVPFPSPVDRTGGFRVFAALENAIDDSVSTLNCVGGCGLETSHVPAQSTIPPEGYNYGVSQGVPVSFKEAGGEGEAELWRCGGTACNSCDPEVHDDCTSLAVCEASCGN